MDILEKFIALNSHHLKEITKDMKAMKEELKKLKGLCTKMINKERSDK